MLTKSHLSRACLSVCVTTAGLLSSTASVSAGDCAYTPGFLEIKDNSTGACGQFEYDNAHWGEYVQRLENGSTTGKTWYHTADRFHNHGNHCEVQVRHGSGSARVITRTHTKFWDNYGDANYWVQCD